MILRHYTIINNNNIKELINELEKLDNGYQELYINSAYVNRENKIVLEIDEKQIDEILEKRSKL